MKSQNKKIQKALKNLKRNKKMNKKMQKDLLQIIPNFNSDDKMTAAINIKEKMRAITPIESNNEAFNFNFNQQ